MTIVNPTPKSLVLTTKIPVLKKRSEFLRVAKGTTQATHGLVLQAAARKDEQRHMRVGYTTTKKIGNAVIRNKTRRRLRAISGKILSRYGKKGFDYVLIGRYTTQSRDFKLLCGDLKYALKRIHANDKEPAHDKKEV